MDPAFSFEPEPEVSEMRVSVRVSEPLKERLARIQQDYGILEADIVRRSLEAFCDYADREDAIRFPIRIDHNQEKKK